jgi:hypothetical protein
VINTDADAYFGSGVGNFGGVEAVPESWHGQPASVTLRVPPLGALWLRYRRPEAETGNAVEEQRADAPEERGGQALEARRAEAIEVQAATVAATVAADAGVPPADALPPVDAVTPVDTVSPVDAGAPVDAITPVDPTSLEAGADPEPPAKGSGKGRGRRAGR